MIVSIDSFITILSRHVHDILTVQRIIRYDNTVSRIVHSLPDAQAFMVVVKGDRLGGIAHLLELAALLPRVRPG